MSEPNHLDGWRIVSDDDNGSLLVESPQGHRKRIWRDLTEDENQELLQQVAELQAENARLRSTIAQIVELLEETWGGRLDTIREQHHWLDEEVSDE